MSFPPEIGASYQIHDSKWSNKAALLESDFADFFSLLVVWLLDRLVLCQLGRKLCWRRSLDRQ